MLPVYESVCAQLRPRPECAGLRIVSLTYPFFSALKMEQKKVDPKDTSQVGLYGEFGGGADRDKPRVRYAVSLTEEDLTVQKLLVAPSQASAAAAAAGGRNKQTFSLMDCVGARSYRREDDHNDADSGAAYFSAYFYPFKKRWVGSGVSRRRVEQCFRVDSVRDPRANLEEAEKWARAIRDRARLLQNFRDGNGPFMI